MKYLRRFTLLLMILVFCMFGSRAVVYAQLSPEQQRLFNTGVNYFNVDDQGNCTEQTSTAVGGDTTYAIPAEWGIRGKLAQLLMVSVSDQSQVKTLIDNHVGGVFLQGRQFTSADAAWLNQFNQIGVPPIIAADEEGGQVQRIRPINTMPSAKVLGTKTDAEITQIAQKQAYLLRTLGVKMAFAPVADLDAGSSVISGLDRAFSADPNVVADKAGTFADAYRKTGIMPIYKHFPGHGHANGDSHKTVVSTPDLNSLKANDLKPYETLLQSGDTGVMMGHLNVPGLTTGGVPTSLSPAAYQLLRNDYKFNGLAITDDIGTMEAIKSQYGVATAASMAIQAGADMALFVSEGTVPQVLDKLEADYKAGKITEVRLNEALARIGQARTTFGISTTPATVSTSGAPTKQGLDNRETTYNFFISKGLAPIVAAGFVGNLMQESGINPKSVNSIGATGVAQWLGGRKANLVKKPNYQDLMVQLEFIWQELNGGEGGAYKKILAATDLPSVTYAIRKFYERPGESEANDKRRLSEATKALEQFGNGTGTLPAAPTDSTYCNNAAAAPAGGTTEFLGDNFRLFKQGDPQWSKLPYSSSTIGKSGCGPTSLAMVVTNLTGKTVLPTETANYSASQGWYSPGDGTSWELMDKGPAHWGLKSQRIDGAQAAKTLQSGGLIIASGKGSLPFSKGGHIIVIRAVDEQGKFMLGNPAFDETNKRSWTLEEMPIRQLWAITK